MSDFTKIQIIGDASKGKTLYSECPYCGKIDCNVVIIFHAMNCPNRPKLTEVADQ